MYRTALIALDHSSAEAPMLECLANLRDMGVGRVTLMRIDPEEAPARTVYAIGEVVPAASS